MDNQKIFLKEAQNLAKAGEFRQTPQKFEENSLEYMLTEHHEKPRNPKKTNHLEYNKSV